MLLRLTLTLRIPPPAKSCKQPRAYLIGLGSSLAHTDLPLVSALTFISADTRVASVYYDLGKALTLSKSSIVHPSIDVGQLWPSRERE